MSKDRGKDREADFPNIQDPMRYHDSVERYGRFKGQIFLTADPIHLYKVLAAAGTFSLHKSCDGGKKFAIDEHFNNLTAIADGIDPAGYFRSIEHAARPKGPRGEQDNGNTNGYSVHQRKGVRNRSNRPKADSSGGSNQASR